MKPVLLVTMLLLSACAHYTWLQNGEPRTERDRMRAVAECERKVGGDTYRANLQLCLDDAGWTYGPAP